MNGFTGKLVIQFTANLSSFGAFDRRVGKVVALAEKLIGAEHWELEPFILIPGPIPLGHYGVNLCTVPNPDHGQTSSPVPPEWVVVETMSEAKAAVRDYLERNAGVIGGGNWGPASGQVWDHQGEVVEQFSFNLKTWTEVIRENNAGKSEPPL